MGKLETQVLDWATEAADAFLNKKADLNSTIKGIADRESLNREKVARVVEEANKAVWLKMFPKQADKCFTFNVADVSKIVEGEKAASGPAIAVMEEPEIRKTASEKTASQMLFERALQGTGVQNMWDVCEKGVLAIEIFREKAMMAKDAQLASETEFCKAAQQMVGDEGYSFEELSEALCTYRPTNWKKIAALLKVAAVHMGLKFKLPEGLEKRAGAAIDPGEHEIVEKITAMGSPVEVINGSHRIVVSLDTLINQATEADKAMNGLRSADDTVKYLRKELRNYLATHRTV
jgi:hypothetical protein